MTKLMKITAVVVAMAASSASAATFDFIGVGNGVVGSDTLALTEGTFVSSGGGLFVGAGSLPDSICAVGPTCAHDLSLEFNGVASNISFTLGGFGVGDTVEISLFDEMDNLLEVQTGAADGVLTFLSAGVTSIFFDDSSTNAGFSYGNWSFDITPTAAVPLPAAGLLLLGGLGALGLGRRKRKAA